MWTPGLLPPLLAAARTARGGPGGAAGGDDDAALAAAAGKLADQLPPSSRVCLKFVLDLLQQVAARSAVNRTPACLQTVAHPPTKTPHIVCLWYDVPVKDANTK